MAGKNPFIELCAQNARETQDRRILNAMLKCLPPEPPHGLDCRPEPEHPETSLH